MLEPVPANLSFQITRLYCRICQQSSAKMSTLDNESDMDLFRQIFGSFELFMPADFDVDDNHNVEIPPDIQHLLDLPFDDPFETKSESETSIPFVDSAIADRSNADLGIGEDAKPPEAVHTVPAIPLTDDALGLHTKPAQPLTDDAVLTMPAQPLTDDDVHTMPAQPLTDAAHPSDPSGPTKGRFKALNEDELNQMRENKYSAKTKQNTKWGVNLFQEWCRERLGQEVDLQIITKQELNSHLKKFFAEAQPKLTENRKRKFDNEAVASEYHQNTMKNARAALNRHFRETNRPIDIVRDPEFKEANYMLDAKLKTNLKAGLNLPTEHKPIIPPKDLQAINAYLMQDNPIALRYRIWFILSIQYVTRGLEFHPQLNKDSFKLCTDEDGREYFKIIHELKEKQNQGGISNEKRMYSSENKETCPVQNLKYYLSKCDPMAQKLFCHINKAAIESPQMTAFWYTAQPVSPRQFTSFMGDICRNAGLESRYTAHCLRATATQALDDAGFETRHIMFMTGHRNEASVRSYSRGTTTDQKRKMSKLLTDVTTGVINRLPSETKVETMPSSSAREEINSSPCAPTATENIKYGMSLLNPSACTFTNCSFTLNGR